MTTPRPNDYRYRATALAAAVALVAIGAGFAVAVVWHGADANSTPLIAAILGIIGAAVPGLVAVFVSERTRNIVQNGLPHKIADVAGPRIAKNVTDSIERAAVERGAAITRGDAENRRQKTKP